MEKLFAKVDDFVISLWLETAGLAVVLSLVFAMTMKLF